MHSLKKDYTFELSNTNNMSKLTKYGYTFDDVTTNKDGSKWSQLCPDHAKQFQTLIIENNGKDYIDSVGSGICGVEGCEVESEHYIDFAK